MSAKWIRSQQWDDRFFPAWAWPAKALLRAFSSIWLAVSLLAWVAVFGILASVPIGMIALIPTVAVYALTVLLAFVIGSLLPTWAALHVLNRLGVSRAGRFVVGFALLVPLAVLSVWAWQHWAWPHLRYSQTTGEGFRLFAGFVNEYKSLPLRRLPGLEMSELEFYAWWPLELVLFLFVINLSIATLRRIEFRFENLGVLTVHTGIITIALGSAYYATLKQEGDMILLAGELDAEGRPAPGQPEPGFFDNTATVLWINQRGLWEQRALNNLPRYNAYGLSAAGPLLDGPPTSLGDAGRTLNLRVPQPPPAPEGTEPPVDDDLRFRVIGYADYADLAPGWASIAPDAASTPAAPAATLLRTVDLLSTVPPPEGVPPDPSGDPRVRTVLLAPAIPAQRLIDFGGAISIEFTRGMDEARWASLQADIPPGARHALVIEIPSQNIRQVVGIAAGQRIEVGGQSGEGAYTLEIQELQPVPTLPIVTRGFENATSSLAVVRITPPPAADGSARAPFARWLYHRFPEITQDLSDEVNERGMPRRGPADPAIRLWYVDASVAQVYLDEPAAASGVSEAFRAIVRLPGRPATVTPLLAPMEQIPIAPMVTLRVNAASTLARRVEVPVLVPERERDKDRVGNHRQAAIAVELTQIDPARPDAPPLFRKVLWLPHAQYLQLGRELHRRVTLPDGREISLAFGRRFHQFPDLAVQLLDFTMFPYPHSDTPRDFRSDVRVIRGWQSRQYLTEDRATSLNDPLLIRVPFEWSPERPGLVNFVGSLVTTIAPNQYKFSQTGWDAAGWRESAARAAAGQGVGPRASFTILGVGNNPGIYVIAAGSVLMSLGIPWAFYVKPWILRRRKRRIQEALARGDYQRPVRAGRAQPEPAALAAVKGQQ
jgi:hypothetical protein